MHHLLYLFSRSESLNDSLNRQNRWKSLGVMSGEYSGCGRHWKSRSLMIAAVAWAVWGQAVSCWKRIPLLRNLCHLYLIDGGRRFLRMSAYVVLVIMLYLGMWCFKITLCSFQKRISTTFHVDGCMQNFLGFGEKRWRHFLLVLFVSISW